MLDRANMRFVLRSAGGVIILEGQAAVFYDPLLQIVFVRHLNPHTRIEGLQYLARSLRRLLTSGPLALVLSSRVLRP